MEYYWGGVIGTAIEIPSFAASPIIEFQTGESDYHFYFPSTGYVVQSQCYYKSSTVGKFVLPKNLSLSKLKSLKGSYPGVSISQNGKDPRAKSKRWKKEWSKLKFTGNFINYKVENNPSGLVKYVNKTKFDNVYAKGLSTYKPHNTTYKNQELLWTNSTPPTLDCDS